MKLISDKIEVINGIRFRVREIQKRDGAIVQSKARACSSCKKFALKGRKSCARHGGKTPIGPANHKFKHGFYSDALQGGMLERYELSLRRQGKENKEAIAILSALIWDDAQSLKNTAQLWEEAQQAFDELLTVLELKPETDEAKQEQLEGMHSAILRLKNALQNGGKDTEARDSIRKSMELQSRIVARDVDARIKMKQSVTLEEMLVVAARTREVIEKYVPPEHKAEFEDDFKKVMEISGGNPFAGAQQSDTVN
jgi:hypothetical protein